MLQSLLRGSAIARRADSLDSLAPASLSLTSQGLGGGGYLERDYVDPRVTLGLSHGPVHGHRRCNQRRDG